MQADAKELAIQKFFQTLSFICEKGKQLLEEGIEDGRKSIDKRRK